MKINHFQGELTDISAKNEALLIIWKSAPITQICDKSATFFFYIFFF